jgi:hypothetical protein
MTQDEIIEMAKQAGGFEVDEDDPQCSIGKIAFDLEELETFYKLAVAKERESFYGQDKPAKCAEGCLPNQICDYCQIVAPVREMIAAEREACAKVCEDDIHGFEGAYYLANKIRARGQA